MRDDESCTADLRVTVTKLDEGWYCAVVTRMGGITLCENITTDGAGPSPGAAVAAAMDQLYNEKPPPRASEEGVFIKVNDVVDQGTPVP